MVGNSSCRLNSLAVLSFGGWSVREFHFLLHIDSLSRLHKRLTCFCPTFNTAEASHVCYSHHQNLFDSSPRYERRRPAKGCLSIYRCTAFFARFPLQRVLPGVFRSHLQHSLQALLENEDCVLCQLSSHHRIFPIENKKVGRMAGEQSSSSLTFLWRGRASKVFHGRFFDLYSG